jgi:hypothetical protein
MDKVFFKLQQRNFTHRKYPPELDKSVLLFMSTNQSSEKRSILFVLFWEKNTSLFCPLNQITDGLHWIIQSLLPIYVDCIYLTKLEIKDTTATAKSDS